MPVIVISDSTSNSVAVEAPKVVRIIEDTTSSQVITDSNASAVVIQEPASVSKVTEIKQGPIVYTAGPGTISIARFYLDEPLLEHIVWHRRGTTFIHATIRNEDGVRIMAKVVPLDNDRFGVYFSSATGSCTVDCIFGLGPLDG